MNRLLGLVLFVFWTSGCAVGETQEAPKKADQVKVKTATMIEKSVDDFLIIPSVVEAKSQSRLSFATGGRLISREVEVGDRVKAGQLLARLDSKGFSIGVSAANASLKARQEQRDQLRRDAERARQLDKEGAFTKSNLEKVESALVQAESALQASKQALRESRRMKGEARLLAPFDGVVTTLFANEGEVLGAGRPVLRLVGDHGLEIKIELSDEMVTKVQSGKKVEIFTKNGAAFEGKIRSILNKATTESGLHPVMIDLPASSELSEGKGVDVRIKTVSAKAVVIPLGAIVDPSGQKPFVWIVKEGRVNKAPIKLGPLFGDGISVEGVLPNSEIVIAGQARLLENDEVDSREARVQ